MFVRVGKKIMKLPGLVGAEIRNILFYYLLIHQRRAQILNVNIRFTQRNAERTVNFGERITKKRKSFLSNSLLSSIV